MAKIKIKKLQADLVNSAFDCGVTGINQMIRNSYFPTLLQHLYAFEITVDDIPVGYYMIGFRKIVLASLPDDIGEYSSDMADYCYALHLRYIAIDCKYQRRKIGQTVLGLIIAQTKEMCKNWPIRLITLDALPERVPWYIANGFVPFMENVPSSGEVAMFYDCLLDRNSFEQYCSRIGSA